MEKSISHINAIWDRTLLKIKERLPDRHVYDAFFLNTYISEITANEVTVVANSVFAKSILTNTYLPLVQDVLLEVTQSNYLVRFIDETEVNNAAKAAPIVKTTTFFANSKINPKYTFDNFVVGQNSNLQAYQAALMTASNPGKMFNPLFIFSTSGLGKSHLLNAIGNYIKQNSPVLKVLYITADDFVDEFIKFVKGDKESESLKDFFKAIDFLLIDDIQFLADKPKTEEMFFHVFNSLVNSNKQIVLTSDRHPSELKGLEDRLVSRFNQGLQINITVPDAATRQEILKKKIEATNLSIADFDSEVIEFLADRFGNNVRDLEGALNRLLFYIINIEPTKHVTLKVALDSVNSLINVIDEQTKLSEKKIINVVSDYYHLTPAQLVGKTRTYQVSTARHIAMYLVRDMLDMPFAKVGKAFGGKDHSTVINAIEKVEKLLKTDPLYAKALNEIKGRLK